ncbi:MAG TPA: ATP-binding protein [Polyangia bacterium]|nr:ATP-binding protein [Polyangia bacterium]
MSLVAVLAISLLTLSAVINTVVTGALQRQFDDRLLDDATAIAGMAEDEGGGTDFEYESLPEFERAELPAYYEAWLDDGTVIARSPTLGGKDLARPPSRPSAPVFSSGALLDGRPGRTVYLRQPLRVEVEGTTPRRSDRAVVVAVTRGTESLARALTSVRRWLLGLAGLTLLGASAVGLLAVSRGLRSTRDLGAKIGRLDPVRLAPIAPAAELPSELEPLVDKLNELLARVTASLEREKRFTADVSHELRTPLGALRVTLDVTRSRERTAPELSQALTEVDIVVRQMQALCENLLALARFDSGQVSVREVPVGLRALVDACWSPLAEAAGRRELRFRNELDPDAQMNSDPEQLRLVIANLLSNAVTYAARGGEIVVRRPAPGSEGLLQVYDSGPPIPEGHLPHLFERFFRGDQARSDGIHCGIGLALVQTIAATLRLEVLAENTADGGVSFSVSSERANLLRSLQATRS